jgi:uncharacterized membrane protein YebE (DUF533 family)
MAYQALKGGGSQQPEVPLGLVEPQSAADRQQLEQHSEIVLKATINAAKADGQIDQGEMQRIVGKLQERGMGKEAQQYVLTEMTKPLEIQALIAAAKEQPTLAAQIYAASLLAIAVDAPAEKNYLDQLAAGLGLKPEVTQRIKKMVGLQA